MIKRIQEFNTIKSFIKKTDDFANKINNKNLKEIIEKLSEKLKYQKKNITKYINYIRNAEENLKNFEK